MIVADGNHQQAERGIQPEGFWRERCEDEAIGPGPCDQEEDVAQEQRKTLMAGGGPVADGEAHESLVGTSDGYGYDHQEVTTRQTKYKQRQPGTPAFTKQEPPAEDAAEYAE